MGFLNAFDEHYRSGYVLLLQEGGIVHFRIVAEEQTPVVNLHHSLRPCCKRQKKLMRCQEVSG